MRVAVPKFNVVATVATVLVLITLVAFLWPHMARNHATAEGATRLHAWLLDLREEGRTRKCHPGLRLHRDADGLVRRVQVITESHGRHDIRLGEVRPLPEGVVIDLTHSLDDAFGWVNPDGSADILFFPSGQIAPSRSATSDGTLKLRVRHPDDPMGVVVQITHLDGVIQIRQP
jgi:hypothetical protein